MYNLYSEFDIEQHKINYINYLEVILFPDGHIEYAIPSHQEKLIAICQDKLGVTRDVLNQMCPSDYYFDFDIWLCTMSGGCASLWSNHIRYSDTIPLTIEQKSMIVRLQKEGLLKLE